jgi:hypothetical protein
VEIEIRCFRQDYYSNRDRRIWDERSLLFRRNDKKRENFIRTVRIRIDYTNLNNRILLSWIITADLDHFSGIQIVLVVSVGPNCLLQFISCSIPDLLNGFSWLIKFYQSLKLCAIRALLKFNAPNGHQLIFWFIF